MLKHNWADGHQRASLRTLDTTIASQMPSRQISDTKLQSVAFTF